MDTLIRAEGQHFKAARGFCLKQSCGFPAALIKLPPPPAAV